jgi:hypothetical protein
MRACNKGTTEVAKLLVERGADVNAKNINGTTALMNACYKEMTEVAKLLVDRGADINDKNINGTTALMHACLKGMTGLAKLLVERGADVNAKTTDGNSPLMRACFNGMTEVAKLLVKRGADINAKNIKGASALSLAFKHTELVAYLRTMAYRDDGSSKPTYTRPSYILSRKDIEEAKNTAESPQNVDELGALISRQKLMMSKAQKTLEFAALRRDTLGKAPDPERSAVVDWSRKRGRPSDYSSSTENKTSRR